LRGRRRASLSRSATDSAFERALSAEIAASELLRTRVVAATLAVLLAADQLLYLFARDLVEQFYQKPLPAWLPARIIGSRPFTKPKSGRIAVKVINHLGDEVMKVFGVR
jgi:hypothetical protein